MARHPSLAGACVPEVRVSVGGGVSASGAGGTKTGELSEAGSVSSLSIVATLTSG